MTKGLDRDTVVKWWAQIAIKDIFLAFHLSEEFPAYSTFFAHQGLEKSCKAYLLGTMAVEYETKSEQQAKEVINKIVKNGAKMGHSLEEMLDRLIKINVLDSEILTNEYIFIGGRDLEGRETIKKYATGREVVKILESAYEESRYPVPYPIHLKYPYKKGKVYWDLIQSSEPMDFAYSVGHKIIKKIEHDFKVLISKDYFSTKTPDEQWKRFCNIFFK